MNRLHQLLGGRLGHSPFAETRSESSSSDALLALGTLESRLELPHRLFVPEHFEPRYDYPVIVWLHSDNSSEWELDGVMEAISVRNYLAIAPRGHRASAKSSRLFRWGTQVADLAVAEDLVFECVDALMETLPVHADRIFLGGVGTGGTVAQWIGLKHPNRFAGVVSMQGSFPNNRRVLASWHEARRLPVLYLQGEPTKDCDDSHAIDAMRLAHTAGLNYRFVRFRDPSAACLSDRCALACDALDGEMFATANRFLMGIVTQTDIPLEPETTQDTPAHPDPLSAAFGWN